METARNRDRFQWQRECNPPGVRPLAQGRVQRPPWFVYCTRVLHLSEHSAYNRIEAARAGARFPITANIELRCRAHNAYETGQVFGHMFAEQD